MQSGTVLTIFWDNNGIVVKRVEHLPGDGEAPRLKLKSANPNYDDCTCQDTHIVGKVFWAVRKNAKGEVDDARAIVVPVRSGQCSATGGAHDFAGAPALVLPLKWES